MAHKSGGKFIFFEKFQNGWFLEAHRALERLEEFHAELNRPTDAELKLGIEKVIGIFKSRLFQALCDIQDFYENILLNERIGLDEKTRETRRLADRWENNPPFGTTGGFRSTLDTGLTTGTLAPSGLSGGSVVDRPFSNGFHTDGQNVSSHSYTFQEQRKELVSFSYILVNLNDI